MRIRIRFCLATFFGSLSVIASVSFAQARDTQHREQPVVAVLGDSAGAELTDFIIPRVTLALSGAARVVSVASSLTNIPLPPSTLQVRADMTFNAFDAAFPSGATYVIVPALVNRKNSTVRSWLKAQAARGATIVAICEGAWTVADAGLLTNRRATSHWHALNALGKKYPQTNWVRDERYVVDDHLISTTGVSASLPVSMFLIEQIAGRALADSIAREIGVTSWSPVHRTADFAVSKGMYAKGLFDYLAWWRHDIIAVPVTNGVDEVALALTLDAIPRTMRAQAFVQLDSGTTLIGRQGIRFFTKRSAEFGTPTRTIRIQSSMSSVAVLASTITQLKAMYGPEAGKLITMGMEIPTTIRQ